MRGDPNESDDDLPTEPVFTPPYRAVLYSEHLPAHLPPSAVRVHREVRRRLRELDMAGHCTPDRAVGAELRRAARSLGELLSGHFPLLGSRCPMCRTRWGRPARWPCHVWLTTHTLLDADYHRR